jgi:uncharacterized protein YndB with AHSA1/START domain
MTEPIRRDITVPVAPARAFEVFTAGMTTWWPAHHHIGSAPIAEIVVEPREGGRWFTRHEDGTETATGYVRIWDPGRRLVLTWQITHDWGYDEDLVTVVDVRFEAVDGGTRVALEHDLSGYGERAGEMREVFDQPGAWTGTLEAFAAAAH